MASWASRFNFNDKPHFRTNWVAPRPSASAPQGVASTPQSGAKPGSSHIEPGADLTSRLMALEGQNQELKSELKRLASLLDASTKAATQTSSPAPAPPGAGGSGLEDSTSRASGGPIASGAQSSSSAGTSQSAQDSSGRTDSQKPSKRAKKSKPKESQPLQEVVTAASSLTSLKSSLETLPPSSLPSQ